MKITQLNSDAMQLIRSQVEMALERIGNDLGVSLTLGRGSYAPRQGTGRFTMDVSSAAQDGSIVTKEGKLLDQFAVALGLPMDVRGKTFMQKGHLFTITGYAPRSTRFPILADRADGKVFKFPISSVKLHLNVPIKSSVFTTVSDRGEEDAERRAEGLAS